MQHRMCAGYIGFIWMSIFLQWKSIRSEISFMYFLKFDSKFYGLEEKLCFFPIDWGKILFGAKKLLWIFSIIKEKVWIYMHAGEHVKQSDILKRIAKTLDSGPLSFLTFLILIWPLTKEFFFFNKHEFWLLYLFDKINII